MRRADRLLALVLTDTHTDTDTDTDSGSGSGGAVVTRGQAHVVVHVDTATDTARIPGGPELPPATTERLACDARVQLLLGDRPITPPPTPSPATSKR